VKPSEVEPPQFREEGESLKGRARWGKKKAHLCKTGSVARQVGKDKGNRKSSKKMTIGTLTPILSLIARNRTIASYKPKD